jgi:hypothetical protein
MANKHKLNPEQVATFKVYEKATYNFYEWRDQIKILGIVFQKPGFYWTFSIKGAEYKTNDEVLKDERLLIVGDKVVFKPHVEFTMSNGKEYSKYFESIDLLNNFLRDIGNSWINLPERRVF